MAASKERCVKQAYKSYVKAKNAAGEPVNWSARFQQNWVQKTGSGAWEMSRRGRWTEIFSQVKTKLFNQGVGGAPGSITQLRIPDLTLFIKDFGTWVVDFKFDRPSGVVDTWGDVPGGGNGNLQQDDYVDMNQQNNPGKNIEDPSLNPSTCKCDQRMKSPSQVQVYVSVPFERWQYMQNYVMMPRLYILPLPAPGALGVLGGAAEGSGLLEWLLGTPGTQVVPAVP